ncbi:hypothetical protein PEPS_35230 (plasmid) [Persicobacter psychrovividus]|uniref:Uncharacterized protein n=1 Tax=Persicobacter psychrovividus TaxID=387638 RepID=A0ABM7VJU6_9BACT|nr:hypothetical protein PEPS_35230 [Persicobacter psychrovividus]
MSWFVNHLIVPSWCLNKNLRWINLQLLVEFYSINSSNSLSGASHSFLNISPLLKGSFINFFYFIPLKYLFFVRTLR